jgi:hypothetical protein
MANLRVFVSSTCYDLTILRSQLRIFIQSMGYEPIMSDYDDVLYDPRKHTHTSCVNEVTNCDILVLVIGSRFGGQCTEEALKRVDFDVLMTESKNVESLKQQENLSISQLEVLKAVEQSIPIYTFIDNRVWHDHNLYEKNKEKTIVDQIYFPSIEKQETATFIFNFINFVRLRTKNNIILPFEKIQDIEDALKKQWASYFQKLLSDQRNEIAETQRIDHISEQLEDLKTAVLSTIGTGDQKEIARGVIKYKRLVDLLKSLKISMDLIVNSKKDFEDLLQTIGIVDIIDATRVMQSNSYRQRTFFMMNNGSFYECRYPREAIERISNDWDMFIKLSQEIRGVIVDAWLEINDLGISPVRLIQADFKEYCESITNESMVSIRQFNNAVV